MKAIQFNVTPLTWVILKLLGLFGQKVFYGPLSGVRLKEMPEPELPGDDWVKIRTSLGGICGSDTNLIYLHDSPSASPFASMPFVIGHENLGVMAQIGGSVSGWEVGERVVVNPLLPCEARGLEPCPSCRRGDFSTCSNFIRGNVSPAMITGFCQSTGGSWGEYFVAHRSQLFKVPPEVPDDAAILVDPLASALHPVMRHYPQDHHKVLVYGAGIIGLLTVASLRALGSKAHITVIARHPFQADLAVRLGADAIVTGRGDYYKELAEICGGELLKPILGKRIVQGGFAVIYDCVGSDLSIDDSLRFTAPGGKMVLVGLAAIPKGVDWTPIWLKEINVVGAVCYSTEEHQGKPVLTYQLAMDLIAQKRIDLSGLVTHTFPLHDYKTALEVTSNKRKHRSVKVAFRF